MDYIPKASMCSECKAVHKDCSHLPFHAFPAHKILPKEEMVVVICPMFEKRKASINGYRDV